MVFEPNFKKVMSSIRKHVCTTQSIVELKLPTNESNIDAIYSVGAISSIVSTEIVGNTINFVGLVDFQTIFQAEKLSALDYTAEFKDKYDCEESLSGDLIVSSSVIQVDSSIVSGNIRVTAIVETAIDIIETKEYSVLVDASSDISYKSYKDIEYCSYLGKAYEKFDVTNDFGIKGASAIYMVTPCVRLGSVEAKDNYILASGVVGLDICYTTSDDLSGLKSTYREVDFTWEVAFDGLQEENSIESPVAIISNEIKVTSVMGEDGIEVSVSLPIEYSGYIFSLSSLKIVDDIYLESNYLSITSECMPSICCISAVSFADNVSGSAEILDTAPFIDDILSTSVNNIVLARNYIDEGRLVVEGVVSATVVYYTKETGSATSLTIDMPFSVEQKISATESSVVTLCISSISAKSRRGKEVEVSGDLHVYADIYNEKESVIISSVSLGEEKAQDECSLYIYIVKPEQTVWDIAKEMNVSSDMILEQNPNIKLPLEEGQKLVIYKSRVLEF